MTDTQPMHRIEPHPMKRPAPSSKAPMWLVIAIGVAAAWLIIMAIVAATGFANDVNEQVASVTKGGAVGAHQAVTAPALTSAPSARPTHTETVTAPGSTITVTESASGSVRTVTVRAPGSTSRVTVTITRAAQPAETVTETVTQAGQAETVTETAPGSTVTVTRTQTVCPPLVSC